MPSSHEQDREQFQRALDALQDNAALPLLPREYPGPIVIRRPIILDGQGSTIWSLSGPVIHCQANGVVLRNIRIEVTGTEGTGQEDTDGRGIRLRADLMRHLDTVHPR